MPELWRSCRGEISVDSDLTEPTGTEEDWTGDWDELLSEVPGSAGRARRTTSPTG